MKTIKRIFIICGVLLILAALALCGYNIMQDKRAENESNKVMRELIKLIPEPDTAVSTTEKASNPADDLFAPYELENNSTDMPSPVNIGGRDYCGYISIPSLELELPVIDNWSYDALELSPCRFSGSTVGNDLIIAAHNYNSHFGRIDELDQGDEIMFVDTEGTVHRYRVDDIRVLNGNDSEGMFSGKGSDWDITLFTCNFSGQARVAVRGSRIENK
ncbi:MAG: sortase [Ruminococcus sp.]|uniref:sortase n=1 Tax=Ruminococcus sp. TaxID=41978 RepID=UPI0025FF5F4F|nr:sortase [Ruminococcus sp.]MCR4795429.1 sortase [Ruminococcus sp.]